ncbi:MAG: chorismate mutase, partial [Pseudomonadota bacterium]
MTSVESLSELRKKIDSVDESILALINRRAALAQAVARSKMAAGENHCFYRPDREAEVLRRIKRLNEGPLDGETAVRFFRELMSACLALEKPLRVAFLGPEGTFTQQAAYKHFGHAIQAASLPAIDEIFRDVESGTSHFGVVPVENSTEGVITHTLDSFLNSPLQICGEVELRIHHNLMAKECNLKDIREIFSHQQSLAQCREWLGRHLSDVKLTSVSSNGEAARLATMTPASAAIAGEVAAPLYGLQILEKNIEDIPDNTTRFLIIGTQPVASTG